MSDMCLRGVETKKKKFLLEYLLYDYLKSVGVKIYDIFGHIFVSDTATCLIIEVFMLRNFF
jgi:hypothetical protein